MCHLQYQSDSAHEHHMTAQKSPRVRLSNYTIVQYPDASRIKLFNKCIIENTEETEYCYILAH